MTYEASSEPIRLSIIAKNLEQRRVWRNAAVSSQASFVLLFDLCYPLWSRQLVQAFALHPSVPLIRVRISSLIVHGLTKQVGMRFKESYTLSTLLEEAEETPGS